MGAGSFTLDTRDFDLKFHKIAVDQIPGWGEQGLMKAGAMVIKDSIMEEPRAPHKTGHLWRSQKIVMPILRAKEIFIHVGFNVPYAAELHETPFELSWTLKGSGAKFIEAKLLKNNKKYLEKIAGTIRNKGH